NPIIPRLLVEGGNFGDIGCPKAVANPATLATQTCGAGQYVVVPSKTVIGDHYTYTPNPSYYDQAAIRFSEVDVKIITQPSTMLSAIGAGQLDVAYGDITTADQAAKAGLTVIHEPNGWDGLNIVDRSGTTSKPIGDVRVRQALNYALDRAAITKGLL